MSNEAAEVRVKLVVDRDSNDTAKKLQHELSQVKHETEGVSHEAEHAAHELSAMEAAGAVGMGAIAAGAALAAAGVGLLSVLAHEGFEAALEHEEAVKRVAGSLMMMANDVPYDRVKSVATGIHEELVETAQEVGVASADMVQAFDSIAAHSSMSVGQVQELTEKMALAGRAVPGGIGALAQGMTGFEQGMIRARNPVVQMIAATGTLHGNAKEVAKQLQAMAPEKQMELAEKAIAKMGERMKDVPLSFPQIMQSLRDVKDQILETLGQPILESITNIVGDISNFFQAHKEEIMDVAQHIGDTIAKFVDMTAALISEVIDVFTGDTGEVTDSFEEVVDAWGDKFDDIKNDAHEIAQKFKTIVDYAKEIVDDVSAVNRVAMGIVTGGLSEVARYGMGQDSVFEDKSEGSESAKNEKLEEKFKRAQKAFDDITLSPDKLKKAEDHFREAATAAEMSGEQISHAIDMMKAHSEWQQNQDHPEAANIEALTKGVVSGGEGMLDVEGAQTEAQQHQQIADIFTQNWQAMAAKHDEAGMKAAAKYFASSETLRIAVLESGDIASGAIVGLGNLMKKSASQLLVAGQEKEAITSGKTSGANINMSGGQTFNIKQDFRDQDPDRVAVVFRRDIAKNVINRLSAKSSFGGPFGG